MGTETRGLGRGLDALLGGESGRSKKYKYFKYFT